MLIEPLLQSTFTKYAISFFNCCRNIRSVIVTWLEENPKDFYQPPDHPCLQFLKDVAMETMQDAEFLNKIDQIFQKFSLEEDEGKKIS